MKKAVKKFQPKNVEELKTIIQKVWDDFPQQKINDLVSSFYQRLHLVIQEKGESIQSYIRKGLSQMNLITMPLANDCPLLEDVISTLKDDTNVFNDLPDLGEILDLPDDNISELDSIFSEEFNETVVNDRNFQLNNNEFSKEEDDKIYELYMKYGPKWTMMTKFTKNRSATQIKNRFRSTNIKRIHFD